ncbi:MAG: TrkH family potassium uptake protein [Firmicutes bacterium]|nr:TrkH family potassium uptake protein [Bacillota bacterium]MDY6160435.1 TrkH family potassium uptake protein [Candidatus Faecousia sp.]
MGVILLRKKKLTSFQVIILGFFGVIIIGTLLLMLPLSSRDGRMTPFLDALFTSTSAVCVTGLVLHDTATYWSMFGQLVILILIQIGGMGVITVAAAFAMISGRKISLMQRSTMQEAISAPKVGGIVRLTSFIIKTTLLIELLGAAVMAPVFCRDFGVKGLWMALFHAISAFCNAGFDLMGVRAPFSSLTSFSAQPVINLVIMLLIIMGGIGFLTWDDIQSNRLHVRQYRMQSKIILSTTAFLLAVPAVYLFCFEFNTLPWKQRILASLFQAVTPRTAGFNTVDMTSLSEPGQCITMVLMLIGGSPGSTAGGMKTTTVAVLFATAIATFRRQESAHFFGRRVEDDVVKNAATILMMYLALFFLGGLAISMLEGLPVLTCLFEAASAVGTVGLSLGITAGLGIISKLILILLMFCGRVGGLTLIFAALSGTRKNVSKFPREKVTVG